MDALDNQQSTRPIETDREWSNKPYPNGRIIFIDNLYHQFPPGWVPTQTRTRSDRPELLLTLPISHQWMSGTNQNLDYPRCNAKVHWGSIDAHSQHGTGAVLLSVSSTNIANTSVIPNSDHITIQLPYSQDQESLTLCWRSFSQWGSDHVAVSFACKCCQYVGFG